ncbi:hypothetical protein GCM10011392_23790 [Wenxinia marina]|nr:hypothetical protein GCM10011392_23790 [Wenxinia marina]
MLRHPDKATSLFVNEAAALALVSLMGGDERGIVGFPWQGAFDLSPRIRHRRPGPAPEPACLTPRSGCRVIHAVSKHGFEDDAELAGGGNDRLPGSLQAAREVRPAGSIRAGGRPSQRKRAGSPPPSVL